MKECNIVKDLLPLYIEELCSEDSREYVEEHLMNCEECGESFKYLKYSEVCVEAVEKKELHALKKMEKYISGRILMSYFLFMVVMIGGVGILLCTVSEVPQQMYYVLMPVTILATGLMFQNSSFIGSGRKRQYGRWGLQLLILAGSSFMMFYMMVAVNAGVIPFDIPVYKTGPIMSNLLRGGILFSLVILITYLYQVGQKKQKYSVWCNLSILCIFMNLWYDGFLYNMFDLQTAIEYLVKNTVGMLVVYAVMTLLMWIFGEKRLVRK